MIFVPGLGFKENDQVWVEVENEFSSLLSKLSSQSDKPISDSPTSVEGVNRSLEEQSKKSKARVHYQKFTRGKDLSRYSKKDLECIFGVSSKSTESKHEENENFVQSGNMSDYFKQKKLNIGSEVEGTNTKPNSEEEKSVDNEEQDPNDEEFIEGGAKKKKKRKKAKKRKCENNDVVELNVTEAEDTSSKKKRKHEVNTFSENGEVMEPNKLEAEDKHNKKKRKNNKEINDENKVEEQEGGEGKESKKKKDDVDSKEENEECETKKKKKKKKKSKAEHDILVHQVDGTYDSSEVEEFLINPTVNLETNCTPNVEEINKPKNETNTNSKITQGKQVNQKVHQVAKQAKLKTESIILDRKDKVIEDLSKKNEELSQQVDAIVQTKISNYLSQVFNRKDKMVSTNPVRELKEKRKKMIQEEEGCVQFKGSNLDCLVGYSHY